VHERDGAETVAQRLSAHSSLSEMSRDPQIIVQPTALAKAICFEDAFRKELPLE